MPETKRMARPPALPELIENPLAPELFASEAAFFSSGGGVVTITFVSWRFDNTTEPPKRRRVVVGRLVIPTPGAKGLAAGLFNFLQKNGLDPAPAPEDPKYVQ